MDVKVIHPPNVVKIVSKIVRVTNACEGCRKKKKSCDGKNPCERCIQLGIDCEYTTARKKRGPPPKEKSIDQHLSKVQKTEHSPSQIYAENSSPESIIETLDANNFNNVSNFLVGGNDGSPPLSLEEELLSSTDGNDGLNSELQSFLQFFTDSSVVPTASNISSLFIPKVNSREQGLLNDAELNRYLYDYAENVAPFMQINFAQKYQSAESDPQLLAKYAICAYSARANGCPDRAHQIIKMARSKAGQSFDTYSLDSVMGFLFLSIFYGGNDETSHTHYVSIAASLSKNLPKGTIPPAIQCMVAALNMMTFKDLPMKTKTDAMIAYIDQFDPNERWVRICRLTLKIMNKMFLAYYGVRSYTTPVLYSDVVRNLSNILYSKSEAAGLLDEIDISEALTAEVCVHLPKIAKKARFKVQMLRIFVKWHTGDREDAIQDAMEVADLCTLEFTKYCHAHEDQYILNCATMLYLAGKHEHAQKMYDVAKNLHKLLAPNHSLTKIPGLN